MTTVLSNNRAYEHDFMLTGNTIAGYPEHRCDRCGVLAVGDGPTIYETRPCTPFARPLDNTQD